MEQSRNGMNSCGEKHAYLLLIHELSSALECCMKLLDDERNDFYIHIDKKAKKIDKGQIKNYVTKSEVVFVKPRKIYWGTDSMTKAEFVLLKAATKKQYAYYHLLSGADMPIKSKQYIFDFFKENMGKEFIHFGTEQYQKDIEERFSQYHFFTKQLGRKRDKQIWCMAETYSLAIQRRLYINRLQPKRSYYGGAQWFSITDAFARYCVENAKVYRKSTRFSQITDEWLMQTMLMNSPYKDNLYVQGCNNDYRACQRYIDWNRGNPYVLRCSDIDELMNADAIFARKFDDRVDKDVTWKIKECMERQQCVELAN